MVSFPFHLMGLFSFKVLNKKKLAETQSANANVGARRDSSSPTELQIDLPGYNHFCVDCAIILAAKFPFSCKISHISSLKLSEDDQDDGKRTVSPLILRVPSVAGKPASGPQKARKQFTANKTNAAKTGKRYRFCNLQQTGCSRFFYDEEH